MDVFETSTDAISGVILHSYIKVKRKEPSGKYTPKKTPMSSYVTSEARFTFVVLLIIRLIAFLLVQSLSVPVSFKAVQEEVL